MKRKVLIISTVGLIYDGITSVIMSYLQSMDLADLNIYIVSTNRVEPNILKELEKLGCHIVTLPSRRFDTFSYFLNLYSFIKKNSIDVVHAHGNSGTLAIEMMAAWLGGCEKRIAHSHNTHCDQIRADKLLRPIFNQLYTDAIACGTDAGKWLFGEKPFKVLKNGRDIKTYSFKENVRDSVRLKHHLGNSLTIGHVGGFFPQKNHKFLCMVYHEIIKLCPDAKLFMIGDGPLKPEIGQECDDIHENVIFTGNTEHVPDLLQAMDGMILPSLFEGLPLVVIEWQINGLPCLLSNNVTKECAITDNVHFMNLDDSPSKWAESIIRCVKINDRAKAAIDAVNKVRENGFDITEGAKELRVIYMNE